MKKFVDVLKDYELIELKSNTAIIVKNITIILKKKTRHTCIIRLLLMISTMQGKGILMLTN